ncbi:MAG: acyl-CoA thioesterase [Phycisphaera sp.]|nr:acyl-CoA thioesterase [Phycisphaera sp.]
MSDTSFQPLDGRPTAFDEAGIAVPPDAFLASIHVGDDGISRGVPHVNNAEYVRWIDRLAEMATDARGFTRATLLAEGRMWFVARHEIDYRGEAFADQRLVAATWLESWTRTTVHRATAVVDGERPRAICIASTRWAYVDLETRRPARIPPEVRAAFPSPPVPGATDR